MFSIKQSKADCLGCALIEEPSCIMDTNSKADLSKVDVVFIAENPGKNEVKKGKPLVGRSGKTFRKYFDKYVKTKCKWLLTNCVLCQTVVDGKTANPDDETIERCKANCFELVKACDPKLIVLIGTSPMKAFGIADSGITSLRGRMFKWEGYDVLVTIHPSFVNRQSDYAVKLEADIMKAGSLIGSIPVKAKSDRPSLDDSHKVGKDGVFRYKIPDKYYTDEYRLIDVQFLSKTNEVLYIFRDRKNRKVYHRECDDYYCYQIKPGKEARKMVPYEDLDQIKVPYKEKIKLDPDVTYEGDQRITNKHAMDYYHYSKGEAERTCSNIQFMDIEVDTGINNRTFPDPKQALYPINMITAIYQKPEGNKKICYVVDNNTEPITDKPGVDLKIFPNERKMLLSYVKDFQKYDPDFSTGWNGIGFDYEYLFNRFRRIKISIASVSKFGEFYVDGMRYACKLAGCVVLDQMFLYKSFTFTKKESYALGFIAKDELKRTKIELPLPFNEMYHKMLNKTIEYNIRDTELLEELEQKLAHINLINELRIICSSSFDSSSSPMGQVDSIVVAFLKDKGFGSKNADPHIKKEDYPGAFVLTPTAGVYNNVTDFDFTSLYPSLIMTYNIGLNNFIMRMVNPTDGYLLAYTPDLLPDEIEMFDDPMFKNHPFKIKKVDLLKRIKDENLVHTINGCFYNSHRDKVSVYSQVLESLLSSRRAYKKKMLDAKEAGDKENKNLFDTRQLVYKVLANSLYGVIANKSFRFFNLSCAAAITLSGQEALKHSITEGDAFMRHLDKGKEHVRPEPLTSRELFGDSMPERKHPYIVTGDTDSIFCTFQAFKNIEKTDDVIKELCDRLQDYLNYEIMKEIVEKHNVEFEFNKLDLKNELIISRGLFLAKKYYAIHVTNNEGRVVDEVKYMGISVKRSDTPSETKVFLKELLNIILKSEKFSLPKLFRYIDVKEKDFRKLIKDGTKTIAKPVGWGKALEEYKSIPQGVRGMMAFNEISYKIHAQGARGYLFHVSGIDLDKAPPDVAENYNKNFMNAGKKLDIVVVPDEEETLPDYYIVNTKEMLRTSFIDRYKLILQPLTEAKKKEAIMTI